MKRMGKKKRQEGVNSKIYNDSYHAMWKKKKFNFISKQKEASCPVGRDKCKASTDSKEVSKQIFKYISDLKRKLVLAFRIGVQL